MGCHLIFGKLHFLCSVLPGHRRSFFKKIVLYTLGVNVIIFQVPGLF